MDKVDSTRDMPLVKGVVLIGFADIIKEKPGGEALFNEILSALPAESAKVMKGKIISIAEYPYQVFPDCIKAAVRCEGDNDPEYAKVIGRERATAVIRPFLQGSGNKAGINDLFLVGDLIWKSHHINSGYIKIEDSSPQNAVVRIYDFPKMDPAHCKYMEGYLAQALKEVGAEWIEEIHEVKCCSKGDECHEFKGKYKPPE